MTNKYLQQITRLISSYSSSMEGILIVNREGIVEYWRAGAASQATLDSPSWPEHFTRNVVGRHILSAYAELTEENSTVMQTLRTGQVTAGGTQVLTYRNVQLTMSTTTYPILDENGGVAAAVDIAHLLEVRDRGCTETQPSDHSALDDIVTRNVEMQRLKRIIRSVAKNDSSVLLYGETGTGKELFAEAIHTLSERKNAPFLAQNCAAIPQNLLESMFFGTEKGGFTGAESKKGLFELADGGTLFLDEINSMDTAMQAKLLKVLEEKTVRHIGGKADIPFDVRIVCASNEEPALLLREGRLRSDFYYRVGIMCLRLPPLRERTEDILPLVEHYIKIYNRRMHKQITGLSQMVEDLFLRWSWPGNVRELKNTIERAFNIETSGVITLNSVDNLLEKIEGEQTAAAAQSAGNSSEEWDAAERIRAMLQAGPVDLRGLLEAYEAAFITEALRQNRRLNAAAERLSMSPQKLQYRMSKLGLKEN